MTLYDIKPRFQAWLRPAVRRLAAAGVTANQVTVSGALGSIVLGAVLIGLVQSTVLFLLLPIWMFLRMALNAVDGMLAREFGQQSKLGALLNEICDVVSDAALYLPFAFLAPFSMIGVVTVIFLATLSEFAGVLGQTIGGGRRYDGPLGKSDRAVIFGALGLWIGVAGGLPAWIAWLMPILSLLLVWTVINRLRGALRQTQPTAAA